MIPAVGASPRSTPASAGAAAHPRVLVVDEALPVRSTLVEILHKLGTPDHDIAVATNEDEALAWFKADSPRLVFAEFIGVHNEDGLEVLHEMLERAPGVKIVLVTAEPRDAPEVRAALRAGIFAYVEKPVRHEKIRAVLQDLEAEEGGIERMR